MTCSIDGCTSLVAVKKRGWCNKHYLAWRRHGDPEHRIPRVIESECSIEGCQRGQYARTWCTLHYDRWFRNGDPTFTMRNMDRDLRRRFESFVTIAETDECIEWPVNARDRGYGYFTFENERRAAHRVSYELNHGSIPQGLLIRHKCDNPPCVNPRHLEEGTYADNRRDCVERRRIAIGERVGTAKLTASQVLEIRGSVGEVSQADLARRYAVSLPTINAIIKRRNWRHI